MDKYDGSLKAEHGTGLNMAPWVEREWGHKATEMMWRIKALADPDGVLSPGVLLNRDAGVHLRNLKSAPPIEAEADNCVECGFCEPVCPSRHLTTTPRQRIVLRREMARQPAGSPVLRALLDEYEYDGLETCAADGTCMLACPLGIDTGKLVKDLRGREHGRAPERVALAAARRWAAVERGARGGLRAGTRCGARRRRPLRGGDARAAHGGQPELVPEWPADMPPPAPAQLPRHHARGRRGRLPAGLHQPDLRPAPAGRREPARGAGGRSRRVPANRSGSRRTWRGTAARRPGTRRATGPGPRSWRRRPSTPCGAGRTRGSCRS